MSIGWPQGIYLVLMLVSIGISIARYGQQKTDTYDLTDIVLSPAIVTGILYWGGFFDK